MFLRLCFTTGNIHAAGLGEVRPDITREKTVLGLRQSEISYLPLKHNPAGFAAKVVPGTVCPWQGWSGESPALLQAP